MLNPADLVITVPTEVQTAFWGAILLGIGVAVVYLEKLRRDLTANTETTKKVESQTNGRLDAIEQKLADAINRLQVVMAERDALADIVRFIQAQPEAAGMLETYKERRIAHLANDPVRDLLNAVTTHQRREQQGDFR